MPFTIVLRLQNMSCFDGSLSPTSKHLTNSKLRGLTLGPSAPIPGLGNSKHPTQPNPTQPALFVRLKTPFIVMLGQNCLA